MQNDVLTYVCNGMLNLLRYEVLNATGISTLVQDMESIIYRLKLTHPLPGRIPPSINAK